MSAHGSRAGYQRGCRCLACRAANAQYSVGYYRDGEPRLLPSDPYDRKLRAMHREYLTWAEVGRRLGLHGACPCVHHRSRIRRTTARRILRLWQDCMGEDD